MDILKIFRKNKSTIAKVEQAVIVSVYLDSEFGTNEEQEAISSLSTHAESLITNTDVGEYDGNDFGNSICTLYFYGESAEALFITIQPVLKEFSIKPIKVLLRYGDVTDKQALEKEVVIN